MNTLDEAKSTLLTNEELIQGYFDKDVYYVREGKAEIIPSHITDDANMQLAWIEFRSKRNRNLAASDWTQVGDAPVDRLAWAEYRQALRDLPDNTVDPHNPAWPTAPGAS